MASSSSSVTEEKLVTLKSNDGMVFRIKESVAIHSVMFKNMVEDNCASNIPVNNVNSRILSMVLEYLNYHGDSRVSEIDKKNFDSDFVKKYDQDLSDLIMAANYLEIRSLLDLTARGIADKIKDYTVEQARSYFNIENDLTPQEEAAIRRENAWAFE